MTTQNQEQQENPEVLQPSALMAIERAQIDSQVATAHAYPRTMQLFRKKSLDMATLDQETAESCCYVRPVGKKQVNGKWVQEYAEGASIRLAEIVAACYGNLRVAARIVEQTTRFVRCEGVAHDLESNYAGKSEAFEPTVKSDGSPYSEGMRAVVAKACLAKAYRDAVFKVVPRALCKPVYEAAKRVAAGEGQTIEKRRLKAKAWLSQIKVDDDRLFAALDVQSWDQIGEDELQILTGLKTSIADKDTTLEEAFPKVATAPQGFSGEQPKKVEPAKTAEPAKTSQEPPAAQGGDKGAPEQETPQAPQAAAQAEGNPEPAQSAPGPEKAPFKAKAGETDETTNLRFLMHQDDVTEEQVVKWAQGKKLLNAEKGQNKIADMSGRKLLDISKAWTANVLEIKAL